MQKSSTSPSGSSLDGLWVVVVGPRNEDGNDTRIPVMAQAGDEQKYLLGFKDVARARQFLESTGVDDAEPHMVVKGNRGRFLALAQENGAMGVLVDYDPSTREYRAADALY